MKYLIGAFFGTLFFLSFASALRSFATSTDCTQADIIGSWKVYQSAGALGYQHCGLVVDAIDGIVSPGTSCTNADGIDSTITSGRLTVESSCRVKGQVSNTFGTFIIDHAWLEPDKNVLSGVGKDATLIPMTIQVIRRPYVQNWPPSF